MAFLDLIHWFSGGLSRSEGLSRDLTELNRAQDALRESEGRLRAVVETAVDGIVTIDDLGNITLFSPAAVRIFGYAPEEVIGKNVNVLMPPPFNAAFNGHLHNYLLTGIKKVIGHQREVTGRRKDGSQFPMDLSVSETRLAASETGVDKRRIFTGIVRDTTQRKESESAAQRLAAIVESSTDAIVGKDLNGVVTSWNSGAVRIFGYSAEEMIGRPVTCVIPLEHREEEGRILFKIRHGERVEHFETERLRKDGSRVSVSVTVSPIKDAQGTVIGASKMARDITEQRRIQIALRESEERFRLLVEGVHDCAIILLDREGVVLAWNAGAERVKGYKAEEIVGKSFCVFYLPEDVALGRPAKELALAAEQGRWEDEGWRVRSDGARFWANVLITALKDDSGNLRGYSKLTRDITDRKVAAEVLLKAGALQNAIFNSANFSSIATDAHGVIQIFNVGAERMLGYAALDVVNKITPADIADPAEVIARAAALTLELAIPITPGFEALVFKASRGIEDIYELTYIRKDGTRFPAVVSVTALREARGAIIGYLLIGTDNTARKQADAALRKSDAQLQTVVENLNEAVVVSDLDGQLLHFNRAALESMGYASLDEGCRRMNALVDTFELSGVDGTAWTVEQWPLARILRGERLCDVEGRMRRLGADWERIFSFGGSLAHDAAGKPLMAVVTFSDITERKQAEEKVRQLNADLEKRVVERTAQLLTANNELEAFSYSVSHDLRAPLRSLDGFSLALLEDCGEKLDAEGKDHLRRIRNASQRMGHLIDDLLNLSRLTRVEMTRTPVDLRRIAREVADELRSAEPGRLTNFVISGDLVGEADPPLLRIALTNLFSNAWKFTSKRPDAHIEFGCEEVGGGKAFFVRDNGVGFDMAYAGNLFGAFQRLHSANDFPGTGIGLVTVQRIINRHGGRIWVESAVNAGATFYFTL